MLISFDGLNFNWEEREGINRLVITLKDIGNIENIDKRFMEAQLTTAIKGVINGKS